MQDSTNPYAPSEPSRPLEPASVPAAAAPQTVRYAATAESITAFSVQRTVTSPRDIAIRKKRQRVVLGFLAAMLAMLLWITLFAEQLGFGRVIAATLLLICAAIFAKVAVRINRREAIRAAVRTMIDAYLAESPNRNYLAPKSLTIDATGLRITSQLEASQFAWAAIERIDVDDHYLYLFLSSVTAEIIPRSVFATHEEFLGYANLARQLWEQHRGEAEGAADPEQHVTTRDA